MPAYKRPESVLVVIYSVNHEVLLLERRKPEGFWQSVTGSLEWNEEPVQAALREVSEETGLEVKDVLVDCRQQNRFPIMPDWRARYAPDVESNLEYVFRAMLPDRIPVHLNRAEHVQAIWLPADLAASRASSTTNRAAIEKYILAGS